jgi:hypothetical protein
MAKTISNNQLTPDAIYLVRGKVAFSRITRHTTDAERIADNKRRMHPIDKNYSNITLYDAQVLARDPNNMSIEEKYATECIYQSAAAHPNNNFSAMNKSKYLPRVAQINTQTGEYEEIRPEGELAQGLDVTLMMRVFKGPGNNGVSLDTVLINEAVQYYENGRNAVASALASYGIPYREIPGGRVLAPENTPIATAETPTAPVQQTFTPVAPMPIAPTAPVQPVAPMPVAPMPVQPVAPMPTAGPVEGNPFSSAPAPTAPPVTFGPGPDRQY